MKAITLAFICLIILPNTTGCGLIIAHNAIQRHYDVRDREVEYRHQERMRELQIREQELQRAKGVPAPIVRDNPF
jgi:hypothetical protein